MSGFCMLAALAASMQKPVIPSQCQCLAKPSHLKIPPLEFIFSSKINLFPRLRTDPAGPGPDRILSPRQAGHRNKGVTVVNAGPRYGWRRCVRKGVMSQPRFMETRSDSRCHVPEHPRPRSQRGPADHNEIPNRRHMALIARGGLPQCPHTSSHPERPQNSSKPCGACWEFPCDPRASL